MCCPPSAAQRRPGRYLFRADERKGEDVRPAAKGRQRVERRPRVSWGTERAAEGVGEVVGDSSQRRRNVAFVKGNHAGRQNGGWME